jgi:peptide deformylase
VTAIEKLRLLSLPVQNLDPDYLGTIKDKLIQAMRLSRAGVGMSAPQIGVQERALVINHGQGPVLYVNPVLTEPVDEMVSIKEGCLSFPGVTVLTKRHAQVTITDALNGVAVLYGVDAVVAQHEVDHLDGILFFDRGRIVASSFERNAPCFCGKHENGKPVKFKNCHG